MSFDVPDACTLPTVERPSRLAEFDALFAAAVGGVERVTDRHARLRLAGPPGLAATVRDLTARETRCCSFFTFTVTPTDDAVILDVEVPDGQTAVLTSFASRAGREEAA